MARYQLAYFYLVFSLQVKEMLDIIKKTYMTHFLRMKNSTLFIFALFFSGNQSTPIIFCASPPQLWHHCSSDLNEKL